jgi:ribosomal protein S27E
MCALVSLVPCPNCGGFVLVSPPASADEPAREPVQCEICGQRLLVSFNRETGEILCEKAKPT